MRLYETIFIARQDISSSDAEELTTHFENVIKELGGKILKSENWGLRSLAYKINKGKKGHYTLINFEGPEDSLKELERKFRLHEDIIRSMTIRIESFDKEPSVILRQDDDRHAA